MSDKEENAMGLWEKYLTVWVALCMAAGVGIGYLFSGAAQFLDSLSIQQVNLPIGILLFLMIYPIMIQIDFQQVVKAVKAPRPVLTTLVVNWCIKPFTMTFFAWLFMTRIWSGFISPDMADQYTAGMILLGIAPCTAMVFVWSYLSDGDPAYTLVQVSTNDMILLFAYVPLVTFLLGVGGISVPYDTLALSVILFVVIPLSAGYISRKYLIDRKGEDWFENVFLERTGNLTIFGLLLTLILLFSFQGNVILNNPLHILLIAIPLIIQTFLIFSIAYGWSFLWDLKHDIAAPAAMIGASNFFELAVAVAISVFGISSGAALATVVGVLVEVPLMLTLVGIANRTTRYFS